MLELVLTLALQQAGGAAVPQAKPAATEPAPVQPTGTETAAEKAAALGDVRAAGRVIGLDLDPDELELMLPGVGANRAGYARLREHELANAAFPALIFTPLLPGIEPGARPFEARPIELPDAARPADLATLVYADIPTLAALVRSRKVSCAELCETFLARLKHVDERLLCVVTFTEERARAQAAALDRELADGHWRGPLHGIPWGAKDLLAVSGTPTTWGSRVYEDQRFDEDATVVRRLDATGAVLIAKLSLGELAWGDVWFRGTTRNPWNPEQGSSGSSAGSAAAVAAGGVAFSLGSETLGSIVSPSARCGASSLRPTFGRVSRHGAMTLSWSMDKLGVLARSAQDAALVFAAIQGPDGKDPSVQDRPFAPSAPVPVAGWRVGVPKGAFDEASDAERRVLGDLEGLGVELVDVEVPDYPLDALLTILSVEAATAFDGLVRDGRDDRLVRQVEQAWPNVFRTAELVPAVEYLSANRVRADLMRDFDAALGDVDVLVHPSFAAGLLQITNLTGHPAVVVPCGFRDDKTPISITFTGRLFGEERLLALVAAWQAVTDHHLRHPDL
jgi:Asp-tRNA(Asn)/Glu-tRNA(Gln) amidotransferase A subunit family amidase